MFTVMDQEESGILSYADVQRAIQGWFDFNLISQADQVLSVTDKIWDQLDLKKVLHNILLTTDQLVQD